MNLMIEHLQAARACYALVNLQLIYNIPTNHPPQLFNKLTMQAYCQFNYKVINYDKSSKI